MRSPIRWFRRRMEKSRLFARLRELEGKLSKFRGRPVKLVPASAKGGYDEINLAFSEGKCFAVVRVNSPYKTQRDLIGPYDPGLPLPPGERLKREWDAYSKLFPLGISPQPLWRDHEAIACSWNRWRRASVLLAKRGEMTWNIIERVLAAVGRMHEAGVVHLDLNTGNFLVQKTGPGICIIDFEFGPAPWAKPDQQKAYDYLRLIDDFCKPRRGGKWMLADLLRLRGLLEKHVPVDIRHAQLGFVLKRLRRLEENPPLREMLERIFPHLQAD